MDSLLASAGPIEASSSSSKPKFRKPLPHQTVNRGKSKPAIDPSLHSILSTTRLSSSLQSTHQDVKPSIHLNKIGDKKLRAKLAGQQVAQKRSNIEREQVQEYLNNTGEDGGIEVDLEAGERTWRVGQDEIVEAVGAGSAGKKFDLKLETVGGGGYRIDYTRNGRHLALAGSHGHVATFDWQAGRLHSEIQLGETVRDIKFLHSEAFYAVAQKKYVFIYDQFGTEVHKMKQHLDVTRMEFLPYHYLLATIGNQGILRYHDTSTGTMVAEHKSRMGSVQAMAQNRHNAIVHLGHQNGQVTLWSPSMSTPHVKLLAHMGPVQSISVDPSSSSCGRYMSTSGADGSVKIWDCRNWGQTVREWNERGHGQREVDWSMKGMLAVSNKGYVNVYRDCHSPSVEGKASPPRLYQKLNLPSRTPRGMRFVPFEDILGVGHDAGFSSLLVPGSGLAQFDSNEADVYESKTRRREREVRGVLEKIKPDLITMDADFLGRMADPKKEAYSEKETPFYKKPRVERLRLLGKSGEEVDAAIKAEQEEAGDDSDDANGVQVGKKLKVEKLKHKMRGRDKGVKKFLRKKRKNVVDPALVAAKEKVQNQRAKLEREKKIASGEIKVETGALARFG